MARVSRCKKKHPKVSSNPKRFEAVITAKGAATKYWIFMQCNYLVFVYSFVCFVHFFAFATRHNLKKKIQSDWILSHNWWSRSWVVRYLIEINRVGTCKCNSPNNAELIFLTVRGCCESLEWSLSSWLLYRMLLYPDFRLFSLPILSEPKAGVLQFVTQWCRNGLLICQFDKIPLKCFFIIIIMIILTQMYS